jgi:hypothetical protein
MRQVIPLAANALPATGQPGPNGIAVDDRFVY